MGLQEILGIALQKGEDVDLWEYLPVRTTFKEELLKASEDVFDKHYEFSKKNIEKSKQKPKPKWGEFVPNISTDDAKNDLIMLKLRGLIDQKQFARSTEMKKLPKQVQQGVISGGGGFENVRKKKAKKHNTLVESLLQLNQEIGYSNRKFADIQKLKQRRRKITKKSLARGKGDSRGNRSNYQ